MRIRQKDYRLSDLSIDETDSARIAGLAINDDSSRMECLQLFVGERCEVGEGFAGKRDHLKAVIHVFAPNTNRACPRTRSKSLPFSDFG